MRGVLQAGIKCLGHCTSLRAWGMSIARRRGMARARVAVARKLAVILHRMWVDATAFRYGEQPVQAACFYGGMT